MSTFLHPKLGIVCGYGIEVDQNLKQYIDAVHYHVSLYELDTLILSGGASCSKSPLTEAEVMHTLLSQAKLNTNFILETHAITTLHNLLYSKEFIKEIHKEGVEIYLFCDTVRYLKVLILSQVIFWQFKRRVIKIDRKEDLRLYFLQIPSTINQTLGAFFPSIAETILRRKQRWIEKHR